MSIENSLIVKTWFTDFSEWSTCRIKISYIYTLHIELYVTYPDGFEPMLQGISKILFNALQVPIDLTLFSIGRGSNSPFVKSHFKPFSLEGFGKVNRRLEWVEAYFTNTLQNMLSLLFLFVFHL